MKTQPTSVSSWTSQLIFQGLTSISTIINDCKGKTCNYLVELLIDCGLITLVDFILTHSYKINKFGALQLYIDGKNICEWGNTYNYKNGNKSNHYRRLLCIIDLLLSKKKDTPLIDRDNILKISSNKHNDLFMKTYTTFPEELKEIVLKNIPEINK